MQDLGWSYDSSILVSVGLDSKVVVWSGHTFERLKTLGNHQSHVKGLTFDPANKYFATASDDRTIKIFRFTPPAANATSHDQMNNFILESTIVQPFASSPLTTYFRRCSWSPDGNHIAAANATNGPVSSVAIINRGQWDSEINLIGHEGPVEVCAFSPRLFANSPEESANQDGSGFSTQTLVTVIACAGQDKALSVWNTSHPRPLLITQEFASKAISDLAWSPDGNRLFVTSLDGSILALMFEQGDLGYVVGEQENEKSLARFGGGRRGAGLVEGTDSLLLEEMSKEGEIRGVEGRMGELMGDSAAKIKDEKAQPAAISTQSLEVEKAPITNGQTDSQNTPAELKKDPNQAKLERLKQRVTITKDGKKRIAPLLVSSASGAAESSLPKPQFLAASASSVNTKVEGPQSILDLSKPFDGLPPGGLAALLLGNKRKLTGIDGEPSTRVEKQIANASKNGSVPVLTNGVNGVHPAQSQAPQIGPQTTPDWVRPAVLNPSLSLSQVRLAVPKLRALIIRNIDAKGNIVTTADGAAVDGTTTSTTSSSAVTESILEVRNPSGANLTGRAADREPARIGVSRRGQSLWQDFLPKSVILVAGNQNLWAAACEDGSIYIWTPAGRRMINPLLVESQPVILESRGWWLLCITAIGICHVWNLKTLSSPHPPVSLAPVLEIATQNLQSHPTNAPAVTSARLNSEGSMIITLSNGDGYTYSSSMYIWQRLSESWWAVGSQYWNSTDSSVSNLQSSTDKTGISTADGEVEPGSVSAGIIPYLERNTTNESLGKGRAFYLQRLVKQLLSREGYESFESGVSIAHLENRLAAALLLSAKEEFRQYLFIYAKRLGAEGLRNKSEELLKTLMGPTLLDEDVQASKVKDHHARGWESSDEEICGWSRHELMKGVVLILGNSGLYLELFSRTDTFLGKHRDLQRLTVPYANILGIMDARVEDEDDGMVS